MNIFSEILLSDAMQHIVVTLHPGLERRGAYALCVVHVGGEIVTELSPGLRFYHSMVTGYYKGLSFAAGPVYEIVLFKRSTVVGA